MRKADETIAELFCIAVLMLIVVFVPIWGRKMQAQSPPVKAPTARINSAQKTVCQVLNNKLDLVDGSTWQECAEQLFNVVMTDRATAVQAKVKTEAEGKAGGPDSMWLSDIVKRMGGGQTKMSANEVTLSCGSEVLAIAKGDLDVNFTTGEVRAINLTAPSTPVTPCQVVKQPVTK